MEEQKHYVFKEDKRMMLKDLLMQFGIKGGDPTTIVVEDGSALRITSRRYLESTPNRKILDKKVVSVTIPYVTPNTYVKTIKFELEN